MVNVTWIVPFADHLAALLPIDLPNRGALIVLATRHLDMIVEINQRMNLTRIVDPREAAIKHVIDSVTPWALFGGAKHILDAGTGAGFPGIPLAAIFPGIRFTLAESTQKKARFVETVAEALELQNVTVVAERAEDVLRARRVDCITARALAPLDRAAAFFGPAVKSGARALLYKGPDAEREISGAEHAARKFGAVMSIAARYDLPDNLGSRTIVLMEKA